MVNILRTVLLAFLVPLSSGALAGDWQLAKDKDGIQVYTRDVEGSPYNAVKVTTVVSDVRVQSMVALLLDAPACERWAEGCAESYLHEQININESYVYTHNDMPFPVKDRDSVAKVHWQQLEDGSVRMDSVAVSGVIPEKRGRLRLTKANASWHFIPKKNGKVEVVNQAHIDPGSPLPGWITNLLLVETPFKTMKTFVAEARSEQYANAEVSFIRRELY